MRSDDVIMSALEYDRIDRGMEKLTNDLAAATARAERAERELDDKTVALGEAESWITRYAIERDQARSRAERAEEALAVHEKALRAAGFSTVADLREDRDWWAAGSERARALLKPGTVRWTAGLTEYVLADDLRAALDGTWRPARPGDTPGSVEPGTVDLPVEPSLDGTGDAERPAEPQRAGRFETLLAGEHEQFDQRGELLASVVEYMNAPSGTVSAQRSAEETS